MNSRKLKRYVMAMVKRGANVHELIKDMPPAMKMSVLEYVEKKNGTV
jgi:hypothetical protein